MNWIARLVFIFERGLFTQKKFGYKLSYKNVKENPVGFVIEMPHKEDTHIPLHLSSLIQFYENCFELFVFQL